MEKKKVDRAIKLLQSIKSDEIELSFSGGKDSCVILELAKMAGIPYRAIYKNTTIDPPETIQFCKYNSVEIIRPKESFFDLVEKRCFPTMQRRFCCKFLKEYKILDNSIQGIRRCESIKRYKRYKEPVVCRIYGNKNNHVNVFYPILYWTDRDISDFINERKIQCHPLYYTKGVFDVKKRLGCMACPLQGDKGLSDFKKYPQLVKLWMRAGQKWWDKPRDEEISTKIMFSNIYEVFTRNIFFDDYESFVLSKNGMFGTVDCKQFLEEYFKIEL